MQLTFASLILASLTCVRSQDLNSTIVGCVEIGCPGSTADTVNDNCTVVDDSFTYIGLTSVPTTQQSLKGLTWTKGFEIIDSADNNRTFQSSFFLGAPPDFSLNHTGGCSVFLHGVSTSLSFGNDGTANETSEGTCADAMGSACVTALVDRARTLFQRSTTNNTSDADLCSALQDDLDKNMDDACRRVSRGSWTDLSSTALTGNGSPRPISTNENGTSTCWPVLPKQNQLTHVADYDVQGTLLVSDGETAQFSITPILTVFYPRGDGSIVSDIDASLTCAKAVGPSRASLDTMSDGSDDHDGSAMSSSPSLTLIVAMGVLLLVLL
ncbi:hypothetical protein O1611_g2999 [Lasiodiplodia mahajangana]|uniref:Uncharacterized protein n=1 Tax=Lasiodiplodia mahajangana TaxID=1108764 RepID=A0ACC2JT98_9PEZI|nr:hypothetical protein O1611_g2999 [Lasiodiplodia mahajangana]